MSAPSFSPSSATGQDAPRAAVGALPQSGRLLRRAFPLDELDGVAVRVGRPSGAELTIEKVVGFGDYRRARFDQRDERGVGVFRPEYKLDPPTLSRRRKLMIHLSRLHRRDAQGEPFQRHLNM